MFHITRDKLAVTFDPRIQNLFPDAKEFTFEGNKFLALKHDHATTKFLRRLGEDVPPPIFSQYDWPSPPGEAPFKVQMITVGLLTMETRAYNLNGLGTGKTRCALWSYDFLKRCGIANKMLVVAPLSTLDRVWVREIFRVFPHLTSVVLTGTKAQRLKKLCADVDAYIINHDGVDTILPALIERDDINILTVDELATYRNGGTIRSKNMRKLAATRSRVYGLTGSPMPKHVTDIWGQAIIVTPGTVPKYMNHLRQDLCYKAGPFKWEPKPDAIERAFAMLQPSVRFSLDDVLELPNQVMQYIEVPLGAKQSQVYTTMKNQAVALVDGMSVDALNAGAVLSKLLQIALGWVYTRDGRTIELDNGQRVQTIVDQIDAAARKVLVFVPFKSALAGLSKAFDEADIDHCVVSGDTPVRLRNEYFAAFQDTPKYKAILAHPGCMAHGLTLTAADTVIWGGPVPDLETFLQANGRVTRIGQKHKQLIIMIGGTPVEKKIYTALGKKESIQTMFLDLLAEASNNL